MTYESKEDGYNGFLFKKIEGKWYYAMNDAVLKAAGWLEWFGPLPTDVQKALTKANS